jgi:hypothetical protein
MSVAGAETLRSPGGGPRPRRRKPWTLTRRASEGRKRVHKNPATPSFAPHGLTGHIRQATAIPQEISATERDGKSETLPKIAPVVEFTTADLVATIARRGCERVS